MTPITPLDLAQAFGVEELAQVGTPEREAQVEAALLFAVLADTDASAWSTDEQERAEKVLAVLTRATNTANAQVGRVASGRTLSSDEAEMLRAHALDLARYRLYDDAQLTEDHPVRVRAAAATRFLERVASGVEALGQPATGTAGMPGAQAPGRQFTTDTLRGF